MSRDDEGVYPAKDRSGGTQTVRLASRSARRFPCAPLDV